MHPTKTDGQQWSIRAEFTVSPQGVCVPDKNCLANTTQDKSGIRLSYCWKSNENTNAVNTLNCRPGRNLCKPVEYQKGSLTFTSTPPCRLHTTYGNNFECRDSGYGSDLMSLNSLASGTSQSANNRKCRSTCSIVLCSNVCNNAEENSPKPRQTKYEKNDILSCQTPAIQNKRCNTNFYDCRDPCYQHTNSTKNKKLSEEQVLCNTESQYPTEFLPSIKFNPSIDRIIKSADYKPYKRDVSIQTSDSLQKCSITNLENSQKEKLRKSEKTQSNNFNRNSSIRGQYSSSTRDSGKKLQASSSGQLNLAKNWETVGHTSDSSKKSRTIHIDVYCTDTDMELSETSSDSWESTSTPQTVFESRNVCVTHERASDSGLPFKLKRRSRRKPSNLTKYVEMDDSDNDDVSSTSYPSKIDSYSTINDFSSSISSIKSWKSHSLLSCSNDSVKNFNRAGILPSVGKPVLHELNTERKYVTRGNPSQDYGKHTLKQQTPYSKTLILNENNDIKENMINKKNEKHFKACGKGISSLKSSESNSCIKHKEEISHPKLDVNSTTSCPVLEILPNPRCTEQLASRFDQVINIFKNPGRHKGPTKNPDCNCDYCRRYFM